MKLSDIFRSTGEPFSYYPGFIKRFEISVNATVLLCFIGWKTFRDEHGEWRHFSTQEIEDATGLTIKEQATARKLLVSKGLIEDKYVRLEHKLMFRIADGDTGENGKWPFAEVANAPSGHSPKEQMGNRSKRKSIIEKKLVQESQTRENIAASPPRVLPDGPKPDEPKSPHVQFVDGWTKAYKEHYGIAYKFAGAKDGVAAKSLLATGRTPQELLEMAKQCWSRTGFDFQQATTIAGFNSRYNQIATQLLKPNGRRFEAREHQEQVEVPEY